MTGKVMTYRKILVDKQCKGCNCYEECLRYSKMKTKRVTKDMGGCCTTLGRGRNHGSNR